MTDVCGSIHGQGDSDQTLITVGVIYLETPGRRVKRWPCIPSDSPLSDGETAFQKTRCSRRGIA